MKHQHFKMEDMSSLFFFNMKGSFFLHGTVNKQIQIYIQNNYFKNPNAQLSGASVPKEEM